MSARSQNSMLEAVCPLRYAGWTLSGPTAECHGLASQTREQLRQRLQWAEVVPVGSSPRREPGMPRGWRIPGHLRERGVCLSGH